MPPAHQPLLLLLGVLASTAGLKLPPYISGCSRHDPNLNECALRAGRAALPKFINGDRTYKIPNLEPLKIETLKVDDGSGPLGLAFEARNASIIGLSDSTINAVRIDLEKRHVEYDLAMPRIELNAEYNVSGRVLLLPITGNGDGNITLVGLKIKYIYDFDLKPLKEGSTGETKLFAVPQISKLEFNITRAYIYLDNLFNGDKLLGETTNRVLNENWPDLAKQVGPTVGESIGEVMRQILENIFRLVPYDNAFPDIKN